MEVSLGEALCLTAGPAPFLPYFMSQSGHLNKTNEAKIYDRLQSSYMFTYMNNDRLGRQENSETQAKREGTTEVI